MNRTLAVSATVMLLCLGSIAQAVTEYTVTDLGFSANRSEAYGVNQGGQIVGYAETDSTHCNAFIWDKQHGGQYLGTLGGSYTKAQAINDNGHVVGWSKTASGVINAFLWSQASGMRSLGSFGGESRATSINDGGEVVGWSIVPDGSKHGFVWDQANGMVDLGLVIGGDNTKLSINSAGLVIGVNNENLDLYAWERTTGFRLLYDGTNPCVGSGINDTGVVVGRSYIPNSNGDYLQYFATLWDSNHQRHDLGYLPGYEYSSWANGINNNGIVVGASEDWRWPPTVVPFIWNAENGMQFLSSLGVRGEAFAINDSNLVVGWGDMGTGYKRACYWELAADSVAPLINSVVVSPQVAAVGDAVHVTVDVTDNIGVTSVTVNGTALVYSGGSSWNGNIVADSTLGPHIVTVVARDAASNSATDTSQSYKTVRVVGINNRDLVNHVTSDMANNFLFVAWGHVNLIDANMFELDDGSNTPIRVAATGHGLQAGDYVVARGIWSMTVNPHVLNSRLMHIAKAN